MITIEGENGIFTVPIENILYVTQTGNSIMFVLKGNERFTVQKVKEPKNTIITISESINTFNATIRAMEARAIDARTHHR